MKPFLGIFVLTAFTSVAAIVDFNLSPPGTDKAVGISPLNEVPAATNSTGSGGEIPPGIFLDTTSRQLGFAIGYGSSEGFTDLTGVPTAMHFHAPAGPGTNAPVVISLVPFNVPASNPATGGRILGAVTLTTNQFSQILNGLFYVNIHTPQYTGGEVRGQVIPVATNLAPVLTCPAPAVAECASSATLTATVADPEGDAITLVWTLNGLSVQTNNLAASAPNALNSVALTAVFPLGTNSIGITVSDAAGNTAACSSTIIVVDTTPPVIVSVSASPNSIWPPNHKMIPVQISAVVTDACTTATWKIVSVTSNQAVNGKGDGNTSTDWQIVDDDTAKIRAERSGKDGSRVYTITIRATDLSGNQSSATVTVTVPHDQSGKSKPKPKPSPPAKGKGK